LRTVLQEKGKEGIENKTQKKERISRNKKQTAKKRRVKDEMPKQEKKRRVKKEIKKKLKKKKRKIIKRNYWTTDFTIKFLFQELIFRISRNLETTIPKIEKKEE